MAPTSTSRALASKAAPSKKYKNVNWKILSRDQQQKAIDSLLDESEDLVQSAEIELQEARELVGKAGLSIDGESDVATAGAQASFPSATAVASTTGGHSNTDHVVFQTGDAVTDRIQELKRNLSIRTSFAQQHTESTLQKWDKPRAPGERRRRVVRDNPDAPAEPPPSGYVCFVGQMTTKIRKQRQNERHDQTLVIQEISRLWKLSDESEHRYYNDLADEIRAEYKSQYLEYRATGTFTPSDSFVRVGNFWTHRRSHEKSRLEKELAGYDTVVFPPRPSEFDDEYRKRELESKRRRKLKLKGLDPNISHADDGGGGGGKSSEEGESSV